MVVKKFFIIFILLIFSFNAFANTPRSTGKYKNWESFVAETDQGKICFAQTKPTKRAPGAIKRNESKLFVTFRPADSINDEVSITSGHDYKASSVTASSGKRKYPWPAIHRTDNRSAAWGRFGHPASPPSAWRSVGPASRERRWPHRRRRGRQRASIVPRTAMRVQM